MEACSLVIDHYAHGFLLAFQYLILEGYIVIAHLESGFQYVFTILCESVCLLISFVMVVLTLDII